MQVVMWLVIVVLIVVVVTIGLTVLRRSRRRDPSALRIRLERKLES